MPQLLLYRQRTRPTHLDVFLNDLLTHFIIGIKMPHGITREAVQSVHNHSQRQTDETAFVCVCVFIGQTNRPHCHQKNQSMCVYGRDSVGLLVLEVCKCAWLQSEHISTTPVCALRRFCLPPVSSHYGL